MNEGKKDSRVPFCVCKDFTRLRPDLLGGDRTDTQEQGVNCSRE